jgi:hypothetical protein
VHSGAQVASRNVVCELGGELETPAREITHWRQPPESVDAWGLVMRALAHYWRVTQQDNVLAQALLEGRCVSIQIFRSLREYTASRWLSG